MQIVGKEGRTKRGPRKRKRNKAENRSINKSKIVIERRVICGQNHLYISIVYIKSSTSRNNSNLLYFFSYITIIININSQYMHVCKGFIYLYLFALHLVPSQSSLLSSMSGSNSISSSSSEADSALASVS